MITYLCFIPRLTFLVKRAHISLHQHLNENGLTHLLTIQLFSLNPSYVVNTIDPSNLLRTVESRVRCCSVKLTEISIHLVARIVEHFSSLT